MTEKKSPVVYFKRSWKSLIPQFFLALFVAFVGYEITVAVPASSLEIPIQVDSETFTIRLPVFLLIVAFILVRPIVMLFDSHFEISDHHLRVVRGKLSFWRRQQQFAFEDLLGVQASQSVFGRLLNIGSIRVGSKTHSLEVYMMGVPRPQHYADLISARIDTSRIRQRNFS